MAAQEPGFRLRYEHVSAVISFWRFRNGLLRSKEFVSYLCFGVFSAQSRSDKILKTINMSRVRKKVFGVSYAERSIQPDS